MRNLSYTIRWFPQKVTKIAKYSGLVNLEVYLFRSSNLCSTTAAECKIIMISVNEYYKCINVMMNKNTLCIKGDQWQQERNITCWSWWRGRLKNLAAWFWSILLSTISGSTRVIIKMLNTYVTVKKIKRFTVKMLQTHVSIPRLPWTAYLLALPCLKYRCP